MKSRRSDRRDEDGGGANGVKAKRVQKRKQKDSWKRAISRLATTASQVKTRARKLSSGHEESGDDGGVEEAVGRK